MFHLYISNVSRFLTITKIFFSNFCKICKIYKISSCLMVFSDHQNYEIFQILLFPKKKKNQNLIFAPLHSACFSDIFAHLPTYLDTTTAVHKYCTQVFTTLANTLVIWTSWWCTFSLGTWVKMISQIYLDSTMFFSKSIYLPILKVIFIWYSISH